MATIQVRNLSDETVGTIKVRAARAGQSLQEYMRSELTRMAEESTTDELYAELQASRTNNNDLTAEQIVDVIHREREAREAEHVEVFKSHSR